MANGAGVVVKSCLDALAGGGLKSSHVNGESRPCNSPTAPPHRATRSYISDVPSSILLGLSNFIPLRTRGGLYVDKSLFVREVLNAPAQVMLHARPRRFGKTLNLSMLQAFFEIGDDRTAIFSDLNVWRDTDCRAHFQSYPVIHLTFKDVKHRTWEEGKAAISALLSAEVERHAGVLTSDRVGIALRARLAGVHDRTGDTTRALLDLSEALSLHHGRPVVMLLDEYDAGVLSAWEHGYYDDAVAYFRSLLSPGLKDNPFLFKGVLTGILRVARESMFSGLNNVAVYSLLRADQDEFFGFTEPEVASLLDAFDRTSDTDDVRHWYNGYRFGDTTVYNPWSIVSMLAFPRRELETHWLNTSENALVRSLLLTGCDLRPEMARLLDGGAIDTRIDENVSLRQLSGANIWSLLLFSGYLTASSVWVEDGRTFARVTIPNFEVRTLWEDTFGGWLQAHAGAVQPLHEAILAGDAPACERILTRMLTVHVSSHDVAVDQDEAFYHAFVLGLLVTLEKTHFVRSNRESGRGRADVQVIPRHPGHPGAVLEFKRREGKKKLSTSAEQALAQIRTRGYTAEAVAAGAHPIRRLGIAFSGKDVVVRGA